MKYIHPLKCYNRIKRFGKSLHDFYWYYLLPDKLYLKLKFRKDYHRKLNLKNPQSYNEKLQWLKLYDRNPKYHLFVDKCLVKSVLKDIVGESHIVPTIGGPWKSAKEIEWDKLPQQFVLKCNHDSASVVVCKDKSKLDIPRVCEKLDRCVKMDYYRYENRQWAYKGIDRCIFAEKYLQDDSGDLPDFKFHCFNGKPKCVLVCVKRFTTDGPYMNVYDMDWNKLPYEPGYHNIPNGFPKPDTFEEMRGLAEKVASFIGNYYERIDFYSVAGKVYFGEVTFYPGGGSEQLRPEEWDYILGSWIHLPCDGNQ